MTCSKNHISSSLSELSPCEPREKVISVAWPNFTSVDQVSPSHVTVLRCSGGCHTDHRSCVASRTKNRKVAVMLGKCNKVNGGRCEKVCTTLEVEDETECECGCRRKMDECTEYQEWKSETCECECKNRKAKRECLESGHNKVWDTSKCACVCSYEIKCPHGKLDNATCQCEERRIKSFESTSAVQSVERSDTNITDWEIIVIIILSCLLTIFLLIITSLLCMIKTLKHSLQSKHIVNSVHPEKNFTGNCELLSETLSQFSTSEISTCPECSQDAPSNSSIFTESSSSNARSIPSNTVNSSNELLNLLTRETNI